MWKKWTFRQKNEKKKVTQKVTLTVACKNGDSKVSPLILMLFSDTATRNVMWNSSSRLTELLTRWKNTDCGIVGWIHKYLNNHKMPINMSDTRQEGGVWYWIVGFKMCLAQNVIIIGLTGDINSTDDQIYSWERTFIHWRTDGKSIKNSSSWNYSQIGR